MHKTKCDLLPCRCRFRFVVSAGLAASVTAAVVSAGVCLLPPQPANETAITPARDAATMLLTIFFIKTLLFLFILQL